MKCACRENIEFLRKDMTQAYERIGSFIDPSVLVASQIFDDALVQYRKCPSYEDCNIEKWRRTAAQLATKDNFIKTNKVIAI